MIDLRLGDCVEELKKLPKESIDLTITSPPYDNLRVYEGTLNWDLDVFKSVAGEIYRVTKCGGAVVWVVGDATIKGSESGTSFKQALHFMDIGFKLHDTMIWEKSTFSAVGALRSRYAPVFEYMFILVKGRLKTFNPIKDKPNKHAGVLHHGTHRLTDGTTRPVLGCNKKVIADFGQRHNVWKINEEKCWNKLHPAVFPEQLVHDHLVSWSNIGDTVLDPFMGSGTVGKCCADTNRNFIGIEKVSTYFDVATSRINVGML